MLKQLKKSPDFQKVSFVQSEILEGSWTFLETLETKIHFLLDNSTLQKPSRSFLAFEKASEVQKSRI